MKNIDLFLRPIRLLVLCCCSLGMTFPVLAQIENAPVGVPVKVYARNPGGSATLSGSFLASSPGASDGYASASGQTAVLGAKGFVQMEPGKSYTISVARSSGTTAELNVVAPPGYRVIMDHQFRARMTYTNNANIVVQVLPLGARHAGLAGMVSSVSNGEVDWRMSLGNLRNGAPAGELSLIDTATAINWFSVYTPSALFHEEFSDEVEVYRPNNIIRQIIANQVVVDVVTLGPSSFELRCYHPSQMLGSTNPRAFSGKPYVLYRIEPATSASSIKFTREMRDITEANLTAPISRTEIMTLTREGAWPTYKWTRTDWTLAGANALSETVVQGGGTTQSRTEAITVRGSNQGAVALRVNRQYSVPLANNVATIGEVVSGETVGTGTGLSSSFSYYTDATQLGSLGYLKSAVLPGGRWVAYDYYPADPAAGTPGGRVKYQYRPFLNAPATVSQIAGQGEVTYYEYVNDVYGVPTRPSLVETRVNGTLTAKSTIAYNDSVGTANGFALTQITSTAYADTTTTLVSTVKAYRADVSDAFLRGRTYSSTDAAGVRQVFAYQRGTWASNTFTPGTGAIGTGKASKITTITGSSNSSAGTLCPSVGSYQVDSVYLIDGKSTMEVTIRDDRALVVRTESWVWATGGWQQVGYTKFSYDYAGRLLEKVASNGGKYTVVYTGGLKSSETDEQGVTTSYTYDVHGRVDVATRQGSGAIASLPTKFVYDAASNLKEQHVGYGQAEEMLTSRTYDDAGRLLVEAPPGNYGVTTRSYDAANRTETVTGADGATVISTSYLDGKPRSVTGTGTVATYHSYGVETSGAASGRMWHKQSSGLDFTVAVAPRWQRSWTDWLGRPVREENPLFGGLGMSVGEKFYSSAGQLVKSTRTGYAPTLYLYNALGQQFRSGLDLDGNGLLDLAGTDRVTDTDAYLEAKAGGWWLRTDTRTYPKLGQGTAVLTSTSRARLTGLPTNRLAEQESVDAEGNVTNTVTEVSRSTATVTTLTTQTGIANTATTTTVNGLATTAMGFDQLTSSKGYDHLLRPNVVTDSRGNPTTTVYVSGTSLPQSVVNAHGDTATTAYDASGRVSWTRDPKNHYTYFSYNLRGQVVRQWGGAAMPLEYAYDPLYGDRTQLSTFRGGTGWEGSTWPASPGTADTVTWNYDPATGLMASKVYPAADPSSSNTALNQPKTISWTYNARAQAATRTWARGVTTTYGYDELTGELRTQSYSDSTPTVSYTYGRTGQVESVGDHTGVRDYVYDSAKPWRLVAEAQSAFFENRVQTRMYEDTGVLGRIRGFAVGSAVGSASDLEQTIGYTDVGRIETLTTKRGGQSAGRTFRYSYRSDSVLLSGLSIDSHAYTVTRDYEPERDLLTSLQSKWSSSVLAGYTYEYDERALRTKVVQSGSAFADYGASTAQTFAYNGRGEVISALANLGDNPAQPLPYRQYEFDYDPTGNRLWSNRTGEPALREDYTTNKLNQYVTRENHTVAVSGTAQPDTGGAGGTAVAVQSPGSVPTAAAARRGRYWADELAVPNTLQPWRGALTIFTATRGNGGSADQVRTDARLAELAPSLQSFTYDADGNLLSDGLVDYQWDAENRLVRLATTTVAATAGFPNRAIEFRYDFMGRRVSKRILDLEQNPVAELSHRRFLWDGWNIVAEYAVTTTPTLSLKLTRSYTWGLDIASSLTSAGGVAGLLQLADHPTGKTYLPSYDGNGNVVSLVNADTGLLAAAYEYSPYGETLRAQALDPIVADQPFRFSTKYTDVETGLIDYGRRYYSPGLGRFINRDPIEESGGFNLYAFCLNNAVNRWDYLGMWGDDIIGMDGGRNFGRAQAGVWLDNAIAANSAIAQMPGGAGEIDAILDKINGPLDTSPVEAIAAAQTAAFYQNVANAHAGAVLAQTVLAEMGMTLGGVATEAGAGSLLAFSQSTGHAFACVSSGARTTSVSITLGPIHVVEDEVLGTVDFGSAFDPASTPIKAPAPATTWRENSTQDKLALSHAEQDRMGALTVFATAIDEAVQFYPVGPASMEAVLLRRTAPALKISVAAAESGTTVIGRVKDLQKLGPSEKSLLDRLPNLGNPKANWKQNSGVLREEMKHGRPIRDASPGDTGGQFLNAERNLLRDRGWTFDPNTNLWMPPKG